MVCQGRHGFEGGGKTYAQQQHLDALLAGRHQQRQVGEGRLEVVAAQGLVLEQLGPLRALGQGGLFLGRQVQFHHPLHALFADHDGQADIQVLDAIGAIDMDGAGQHALLVLQIALGHLDGAGRRSVIGRAGLEQADDLGAAVTGALDDFLEAFLGAPAHLDEVRERNAADGYSRLGPGPMAAIRFKWTVRRAGDGEYYVDETIGENSAAVVSGPMSGDAAVKFVDERESEARQRFEALRSEMTGRSAAANLVRKDGEM